MLQEIVARSIGREIGKYRHFVGSMHLYDPNRTHAASLVGEGFQSRVAMPPMPPGDPWPAIAAVLTAEARIRAGEMFDANQFGLDPYWSNLIRLLQIFTSHDGQYIESLSDNMSFQCYRLYIASRIERARDVG